MDIESMQHTIDTNQTLIITAICWRRLRRAPMFLVPNDLPMAFLMPSLIGTAVCTACGKDHTFFDGPLSSVKLVEDEWVCGPMTPKHKQNLERLP